MSERNEGGHPRIRPLPIPGRRLQPIPVPVPVGDPQPLQGLSIDLKDRFPISTPEVSVFALPKDTDDVSQSEDAAAVSSDNLLLAVSDGVSHSNIPAPFATALAQEWVRQPLSETDPHSVERWLQGPRAAWRDWVSNRWVDYVNGYRQRKGEHSLSREDFKGVISEVLDGGASATFLGVEVMPESNQIRAVAVGDSVAFVVSPTERTFTSFPLTPRDAFTSRPNQIRTNDVGPRDYRVRATNLHYRNGDYLVLATDSIAEYLMGNLQKDTSFVEQIKLLSPQQFRDFVIKERAAVRLKADDTTLLITELKGNMPKRYTPRPLPLPVR